ncbi:MAG: twin-arginine translocation signal domain-containing protein [Pyrinomonadaceae bacterium]
MATKKRENRKKGTTLRREERRDFLKKVGSIGAVAAIGASLPSETAMAQETRSMGQAGEPSVKLDAKYGVVALNHAAVRTIAGRLRDRMKKDRGLKRRFFVNPREVLGSVGLNEEAQLEILRVDADFKMRESPFVDAGFLDFCICTGCCCTSCCLTCWSTAKFDFQSIDQP